MKAVQSGFGIAFISKFAVETELKSKSLVAIGVNGLDTYEVLVLLTEVPASCRPASSPRTGRRG